MKILKVIKKELKENWIYMVSGAISGLIVRWRIDNLVRKELSEAYVNDATRIVVDGITLDHHMNYYGYMKYLDFKYHNKPNKKRKIEYLKNVGFID